MRVLRGALIFNLVGYAFFALFLLTYPMGAISFYDKPSPGAFAGGAVLVGGYFAVAGAVLALLVSVGMNRFLPVVAVGLLVGYFAATLSTQHAMEYMQAFVEVAGLQYVVGAGGAVLSTLSVFAAFGQFVRP